MKPSHVRTRIIQDHTTLRLQLEQLENSVALMLADETKAAQVAELARQVLLELVQHTELEDAILAPALMEADAWGPQRASQLRAHHESQRAQLRELTSLYGGRLTPSDIARVTEDFVRDLRSDMEHEERDLLSVDVLRDDVIVVSCESG
jgi:DNA repair protein RadC